MKYGCKWNSRLVIAYEHSDKINKIPAKNGHPAGALGYIKFYQKAVDKVIKKMTPEQKEEAAATAKEWNDTHPPQRFKQSKHIIPQKHGAHTQIELQKKRGESLHGSLRGKCGSNVVQEWW